MGLKTGTSDKVKSQNTAALVKAGYADNQAESLAELKRRESVNKPRPGKPGYTR